MCAGARFPLYSFFVSALDYFGIAPIQLAPNGWRVLECIYALYHELGFLEPSMKEVNFMYNVKRVLGPLNKTYSYFYLSGWPLSGLNLIDLKVSNVGHGRRASSLQTRFQSKIRLFSDQT